MPIIDPDWIVAGSTLFAAISSTAAAVAAVFAYRLQRAIARSQQQLLKVEVLLKNMHLLIATFADLHATAKDVWSSERIERLKLLAKEMRHTETVIKSLHPTIGGRIENWRISKDSQGESIPRIVDFILAGTGAEVGDKYDQFLSSKAAELRGIQENVFNEVGA